MPTGMMSTVLGGPATKPNEKPRAAEFFAGVGLVRMALENAGFEVVFANDIDAGKHAIYARNFDGADFHLKDVRKIRGEDVPDIALATASFPCTDLSLAGNRMGLEGPESSLITEFLRVLDEMGRRRPPTLLIENVPAFASSKQGADLRDTVRQLNDLGYACDIVILDARRFLPQSRPRLFIIGFVDAGEARIAPTGPALTGFMDRSTATATVMPSPLRPEWVFRFAARHPDLRIRSLPLPVLPELPAVELEQVLEAMDANDPRWWEGKRADDFFTSLSQINRDRLDVMQQGPGLRHATAYRRTRAGKAVWEIRGDALSGCLRTARGGSSKQAVVEAGSGHARGRQARGRQARGRQARVRWMTAREYARLQGAPHLDWGDASESQAKFALGDAVCVPAVTWLASHCLLPLATSYAQAVASEASTLGAPTLVHVP